MITKIAEIAKNTDIAKVA